MKTEFHFPFTVAVILTIILTFLYADAIAQSKVLKGATLFDGTGSSAVENSVIVIENDEIKCAGASGDCTIPENAEITDLSGKFITPGLVDAHVHFFQTGFFDSRPDALDLRDTFPYSTVIAYQEQHPERYYNAYACSGITAVYDVGGFTWSIDFQKSAREHEMAPHVAAAGPLITPVNNEILNTPADKVLVGMDDEETTRKAVRYISKLGSTGIKIWTLRSNETYSQQEIFELVEAAADEAEQQGNHLIAHATTLVEAKAALKSAAKLLVHSVQDAEVDDEFVALAREQGTFYNPTLIVGDGYTKAYRAAAGIEPFEIPDPNHCVDRKTEKLLNNASRFADHERFTDAFKKHLRQSKPTIEDPESIPAKNLRKVHEAGIPIVVGTDAGNPGTLHGVSIYDELEAMQAAGIPAEDLIVMATRNGARVMQRGDKFGTLEAGKTADLIVLDKNPAEDINNMRSIRFVMRGGKMKSVKKIANQ